MEISERGQYHSALLAIDHINKTGGVNGKKIRPFVADSASNPYIAAREAEKLIVEHKVAAIVGLYTSASRKEVIPIIEKYNSLLFYPTGYEGEEQHPNIIYCGPLPTQNLIHFIPWITANVGKKYYLIGSDYIYPREMNAHIQSLVKKNNGKILGQKYTSLGEQTFEENLKNIQMLNPDIIFSTLVGDSAVSFYKQYYEAGIKKPIASLITAETEIAAIDPMYTAGHYACLPYFSTINSKENKRFLKGFNDLYKTDIISSPMENTYNSVYLLAEALKKCEAIDVPSILKNVKGLRFQAPQGEIMVDDMNQHVWLHSRIGQVNQNGNFNILWESNEPIQPIPFAKYHFSSNKNPQKSLNQLDEELQLKLKEYQPLINELKKAMQDLTDPIVFFDKDGQLVSILHGHELLVENLPFLLTGIFVWRTPALRNSGIAHSFATSNPSFAIKQEHMDKDLNDWVTIGIPVKDKNENLIGSLGIFIHHNNYSPLYLFVSLLSKMTSYCVELLESSDHSIFSYELLNNFSDFIEDPLFIIHNNSIVFESNSAKQLRISNDDFLIDFIKNTVRNAKKDKASKILHQKSSNELFEIVITQKGNYHYASVKALGPRSISKLGTTKEVAAEEFIGTNKKFLKSLSFAKAVSKNDENVLLAGESGTEKELIARTIHNKSHRKEKPFIILNCAATPSHIMNIELFGYEESLLPERGEQGSAGKFELAEGGTLFLDEITDMPLDLQATFLRVLLEKKVTRVGSSTTIPVNVRIIAATNKNIHQEIAYKGLFRSDLYFHLAACLIELPPLRERKEDIPYFVDYFIHRLSYDSGEGKKELAGDALHCLMEYNWPGNIRELKNIIERAFYLSKTSFKISTEHLPKYIFENSREFEETVFPNLLLPHGKDYLEAEKRQKTEYEEVRIMEAMITFKGNITKIANHLGMSRTTLYRKLEKMKTKRQS